MKKKKKRPKNNLLKNLLSQMEDGSAACATTTTSKEEPNVSDVRKSVMKMITQESQNTSDKWKTKRTKPSSPDNKAKTNQRPKSTIKLTTQWLRSMVSRQKMPLVTGPVKDAPIPTILSESNATCVTSLTLKAIECCTLKPNRE